MTEMTVRIRRLFPTVRWVTPCPHCHHTFWATTHARSAAMSVRHIDRKHPAARYRSSGG